MDKHAARSLLSVHRPGEKPNDERIADAERLAASDPELARWWEDDQECDRAIAAALDAIPVPSDLRSRLTSRAIPLRVTRTSWRRPVLLAAAAIIALAVFFGSWRGLFQPAASLASYREEMVGFLRQDWTLSLESTDLAKIHTFLANSRGPSHFEIPQPLRNLEPIGCRTLKFHGNDVALVCFRRRNGKEAHLFVIQRRALPRLPTEPQFAAEAGWMTAAWTKGDYDYLLSVQGDQSTTEKYIQDS